MKCAAYPASHVGPVGLLLLSQAAAGPCAARCATGTGGGRLPWVVCVPGIASVSGIAGLPGSGSRLCGGALLAKAEESAALGLLSACRSGGQRSLAWRGGCSFPAQVI